MALIQKPTSQVPSTTVARRSRGWRGLRAMFFVLLAAVLLLALVLWGAVKWLPSEEGRAWLLAQINKTGVVAVQSLEGDLLNEVVVRGVSYEDASLRLTLDRAQWHWSLKNLWQKSLSISTLEAGTLHVVSKPSAAQTQGGVESPSLPPESLQWPFAIEVDDARLQHLVWGATDAIAKTTAITFDDIAVSLKSTGAWHLINLNHLGTQRGALEGTLGLNGEAPFFVGGRLSYRGLFDERQVGFDFDIDGHLRDFHLVGKVFGENMKIDSDGRFDLFAPYVYSMVREANLHVEDVDPAVIRPGLPMARLTATLALKPLPGKLARGTLEVSNAAAGKADQQRIPLQTLHSEFEVQEDQITFYDLSAQMLGGGRLEGQGWLLQDALRARLVVSALNLQDEVGSAPKSALSGEVWLEGPYQAPKMRFDVADALYQAALKLEADWVQPGKERRLAFKDGLLTYRGGQGGRLAFAGEYDLTQQTVTAQGRLSGVNPAAFGNLPAGNLQSDLTVKGALQPQVRFDVHYLLQEASTWLGKSWRGEGDVQWAASHVAQTKLWLQADATRLTAEGALGQEGDVLHLNLRAPDVTPWLAGAAGALDADAELSGAFSALALKVNARAASWRLAGMASPRATIEADAQLTAALPFTVKARLDEVSVGGAEGRVALLDTVELNASGTQAQHQATLAVRGHVSESAVELATAMKGGWNAAQSRWQGEWSSLTAKGPVPITLAAPVPVVASATQAHVGPAVLTVNESRVRLSALDWQPGRWRTDGTVEKIVLAPWLKLADVASTVRGDLVLSGGWSLSQGSEGLSSLQGTLNLRREQGDVQLRATSRSTWQSLYLSKLALALDAKQPQWTLSGEATSSRYGKIEVNGDASPASADMAWGDVPFNLRLRGELPDVAKVAPLIASDIKMNGRLVADVQHSGSFNKPVDHGTLIGENLSVHDTVTGIALDEGDVLLKMAGEQVVIDRFTFKGGRGTMSMRGGIDWAGGKPSAKLTFNAEKMRLVRRPDMLLVVTGKGDLGYDAQGVSLVGNLRTDYGNIQYHDSDVPSLSDDVVVVGDKPVATSTGLANVQFDVDLGDKFRFRGYGIDTRLMGTLKLRARPNQVLTAYGNVRTDEGTYRAYGQKLEIERGVISFLGPIDNPALDILAIRENSSVDAGVSVKGTAMRPAVELYSNPSMPTNEKLSWLLFDHGTENMDKGDSAILFQVLNTMLAGDGGGSLTDQMFGGVIDEVGVSSGQMEDGSTTQIVTVSKRLSKNLSVGLDKSLNGLQDAVRMTLRLSRQWSVITRFGIDDSTVDTRYTVSF